MTDALAFIFAIPFPETKVAPSPAQWETIKTKMIKMYRTTEVDLDDMSNNELREILEEREGNSKMIEALAVGIFLGFLLGAIVGGAIVSANPAPSTPNVAVAVKN